MDARGLRMDAKPVRNISGQWQGEFTVFGQMRRSAKGRFEILRKDKVWHAIADSVAERYRRRFPYCMR